MLFLISYKFNDANAQEKGAKMLTQWYDKGGPQNRPENYEVKSWIFLPQHGNCLLYTSPSPRDATLSRMPSSA